MAADKGGDDVVTIGKLNPKLFGESSAYGGSDGRMLTADVANYTNITADTLIKTGAGLVFGFIVNSNTSGSLKLWDNTSAATTVLMNTYTYAAGSSVVMLPAAVAFTTGLYADVTGTQDITIIWL